MWFFETLVWIRSVSCCWASRSMGDLAPSVVESSFYIILWPSCFSKRISVLLNSYIGRNWDSSAWPGFSNTWVTTDHERTPLVGDAPYPKSPKDHWKRDIRLFSHRPAQNPVKTCWVFLIAMLTTSFIIMTIAVRRSPNLLLTVTFCL